LVKIGLADVEISDLAIIIKNKYKINKKQEMNGINSKNNKKQYSVRVLIEQAG